MTNKGRYKQAFSALHSSTVMPMEMEKIAAVSKKAERRTAAAVLIACLLTAGGSGVV